MSHRGLEGAEPLLEPDVHPNTKTFKKALYVQEISLKRFTIEDAWEKFELLKRLDVKFTFKPTEMGMVTVDIFDDTWGHSHSSQMKKVEYLHRYCAYARAKGIDY